MNRSSGRFSMNFMTNKRLALSMMALAAVVSGVTSGLLFYQHNASKHLESVSAEADALLALTSSYVSLYSRLRTNGDNDSLPVPATIRAQAAEHFNIEYDTEEHFMARMIGIPNRFISTQPTDAQMAEELNKLVNTDTVEEHSQLIEKDGEAVLRTMYPSIASQTSCVNCHNTIQKPETPWQVGDLMGAYVIDREVHYTLTRYTVNSIVTGALVSLLTLFAFVVRYQHIRLQNHANHLGKLATTDSLTGCLNRRALDQKSTSLDSANNSNAALLALDIDHFKQINDTHGHEAGDQTLVWITQTVRSVLRQEDVFARTGGEEFTVYMPDISVEDARKLADRIRAHVESNSFHFSSKKIDITVSIGAVHLSKAPAKSMTAYQRAADALLYTAKKWGRNQVVWSACVKQT